MILSTHKDVLSSSLSGGILKSTNNGIITSLPINLFDVPGFLSIKGNGKVYSSSANSTNTTPDVLSIVSSKPYILDSTYQLFSKSFTSQDYLFDFELSFDFTTAQYLSASFSFDDNTFAKSLTEPNNLAASIFFNLALNHTSYSGLYQIAIFNVMAEYKSFWEK